ncbi:MAG: DNA translocase FtsK [Bacteroidales bacterium]|jgi:S-DNA-T family DNA segregation ATPase FtsK/SpoIIIE|nr:DNA translocase FtsK [Bacteroidales bacterium]
MANRRRTTYVLKKEVKKSKTGKTGKKKTSDKKTSKSSKKMNGISFVGVKNFVTNEKVHAIVGVFLLIFTLFLLLSFISFCFSHEADDSIFKPNLWETLNTDDVPQNNLRIMGLYFSFLFIKHWFGISSFCLLLLGFIYGVRLLTKKSLLPVVRTTIIVVSIMIWFSMFFAFIVPEQVWLGGGLGAQLQEYFTKKIGSPGFVLLMLFLAFVLLITFGGIRFYKRCSGIMQEQEVFEEEQVEVEAKVDAKPDDELKEKESQEEKRISIFARMFSFKRKEKKHKKKTLPEPEYGNTYQVLEEELLESTKKEVQPSEGTLSETPFIPGEDIFIDDNEEDICVPINEEDIPVSINENEEDTIADNNDELENTDSITEQENLDDEVFQEEEAGAAYKKLEPYDPRADLPHFRFPEAELLENYSNTLRTREQKEREIIENKLKIKETLEHYNITIQSISAIEGPTITLYEIVPSPGIRISRIRGLEDDIALSLSALGIRIIAPIPGKGTIGIEVPNVSPQVVPMRSVILSDKFQNTDKMALPVAIGKTISNEVFVFDLAKMPHVLMAGATGQGKSVGLNAILTSLLYKKHPAELKFILVDPKKVELTLYSKIERHYLAKLPDAEDAIITDTKKVVRTLNSLCQEMDQRYELLKIAQCRNIIEYNEKFKARRLNPENGHRFLPYIVLVFDEFADCIMTAGREVETPIARLAQLARAIGIHLIIATQRPSVNVITGLIKANFPARIAFRVSSKIDSRTILDSGGAENLIGKGDMLISTGSIYSIRVQCALVDTPEIERICEFIGEQHGYTNALMLPEVEDEMSDPTQEADDGEFDTMFTEAAREVVSKQQGSTSFLQRKFKLGYNRAGRIMDQLEREKIVGPSIGSKTRDVLIKDMDVLEAFIREKNIHR